ncbi:flagellar motor protein MotB, partial [Nostoc sp. 3335mG]
MRKLAVVMALASTALAGAAAHARDGAWYVGVEGGAMLVEDSHYSIDGVKSALKVNQHYGYDVDGIVGYDFGPVRIEGEAGYKRSKIDDLTTAAATYNGAAGSTSALSFMVNALLDFGDESGISGYVGGGAGIARVKADNWRDFKDTFTVLDDSDTRFAWQAIAGVRAPITDNIDVGLKYRFFNVRNVRMTGLDPDTGTAADYRGKFRSHSILGSLIFNFGEPAAPPPP